MNRDPWSTVAITLELAGGLPCGACGSPHVIDLADLDDAGARCLCCPRCREFYAKWFAQKHPDIVGSSRVITRAMVQRAIDEMRARIRDFEAEVVGLSEGGRAPAAALTIRTSPTRTTKSTPGGAADRRLRL